jgi:hypothetical protein
MIEVMQKIVFPHSRTSWLLSMHSEAGTWGNVWRFSRRPWFYYGHTFIQTFVNSLVLLGFWVSFVLLYLRRVTHRENQLHEIFWTWARLFWVRFSWFSSVPPGKYWDSIATAASFHTLSTSLFTHHPFIRRCIICHWKIIAN